MFRLTETDRQARAFRLDQIRHLARRHVAQERSHVADALEQLGRARPVFACPGQRRFADRPRQRRNTLGARGHIHRARCRKVRARRRDNI